MLLSIDWDAYSGCRELVFDAPIWGTPDREADRLEAWRGRALKRSPQAQSWAVLEPDFPLYSGWQELKRYAGCPTWITLSHADAWDWVARWPPDTEVLNLDSHHDLASRSGDPWRVRPGNWAGLALRTGRVGRYTCLYPAWHAGLPVAEGYDLARTRQELEGGLPPEVLNRVTLARQTSPADGLPDAAQVQGLLLVQSPAWSIPAHDAVLLGLAAHLQAQSITPPLHRPWRNGVGGVPDIDPGVG